MNKITYYSQQYGLNINVKKTKLMIISKKRITEGQLYVNQSPVERVTHYNYLGTIINKEWTNNQEIRARIAKARSTYNRIGAFFKSHNFSLDTKVRMLRCYVFSVLLYGVESWTLNEVMSKKLEAFEMWLYRRILKIPYNSSGILCEMNPDMLLLQAILQGKIFGKRGPGRRRTSWLKNLRIWFNTTSVQLFRAAADKIKITMMIANIRNG
ncbi:unnamed protein product [Diabrotica balteata]|uniref:Reverse transcriptase domain-containing protein n=1 Tax=Diabrotica balteata TaxID=107213 RepID=A0A9N9T698_DIABA|nr:unnamed protein product [Diabrotica balteata]